jgi:hypothetical protein
MIHPSLKDMTIEILANPILFHHGTTQCVRRADQSASVDANAIDKSQMHRLPCTMSDSNPSE